MIGAGIVGAAIALDLARRGAAVTLLEAGIPGGGATAASFGWITVTHGMAAPCARLRQAAMEDWHRLDARLDGRLAPEWRGALSWTADTGATERLVSDHAERGYDVLLLERAEIMARAPMLVDPPAVAAWAGGEGAVDPPAAVRVLVAAACEAGAVLRDRTPVDAITASDGRVDGVNVGTERIPADHVVLAAGAGAAALAAPLGVALPLHVSPAILLHCRGIAMSPGPILSGPGFEVRRRGAGSLLAAEDYLDDTATNGPDAVAARALAAIRAGLRGTEALRLEQVSVGWRPMPDDGLPIVGAVAGIDGLYLAAMHAGVTLAPTVARLAAAELLDGSDEVLLAPCRADRFAQASSHDSRGKAATWQA
ncbi:D-amino acid dehydrogenase small subunit [Oceanibacterium hippocampi]|uniref:D-amino acid dehydrogenase small subunit n=1 Tax=Oceanibacterium hippocampi TaxID=745714 RepID=A0A1Y5TL95_9PROT|nr:D-amino acid dehydrogenase small subunit [Oceanibacterium hippocampi]